MSERRIKSKFKRGKLNTFSRTPCGHFLKPRERKKKNNRIPIIRTTDPDLRAACKKAAALFFGKSSSDTNSSGS